MQHLTMHDPSEVIYVVTMQDILQPSKEGWEQKAVPCRKRTYTLPAKSSMQHWSITSMNA